MSDTLVIKGKTWTGVEGFKATDSNDDTLVYVRPQGIKNITQNGTVDVSTFASANVNVPNGSVYQDANGYLILSDDAQGSGVPAAYVLPTGTLVITEPGTFNVANYESVSVEVDMWTEQTISTSGAVTQTLDPYVIYHFTGALTSLTITLGQATGIACYHFDFDSGSTAPTISLPNTVTMPDNQTFDANNHYEIDILNNFGAVMSWAIS